jgi:hypothetical protein
MGIQAVHGFHKLGGSVGMVDLSVLWEYTSHTDEAISYGGDRHALPGLALLFRLD